MTTPSPFNKGTVDWSGDNPGIYLRQSADGPYTSLMVWFRVVVSPHGPGNMMFLLEDPQLGTPKAGVANLCLFDNEALARYLVENFCSKFGVFRGAKFDAVAFRKLDRVAETGDGKSYQVTIAGGGDEVVLRWGDLGTPFAADVQPAQSATGHHEMYSCFVEARDASITVNGRRIAGKPFPRDFMGRPTSSAFLAFSETWVKF